eukprot:scaffold97157_cov29-Tisochrysis_lutea.AAC.2
MIPFPTSYRLAPSPLCSFLFGVRCPGLSPGALPRAGVPEFGGGLGQGVVPSIMGHQSTGAIKCP